MSDLSELDALDATALAELVQKREVTAVELVDRAIQRIEAKNGALNAVVTPLFEQARETAQKELPLGPFTGVPFLVKDLMAAMKGVRMTCGTRAMTENVPAMDSELVNRHRRAGLIIVGRTNTPELGILPTTEPALFGAAKNPWNAGHTTGGSSGGSAAAVASGMVPMAHANDGGGSIRIPASCCGLFGLKPTRGRNPLGPEIGDIMGGLVVEHAVTRSVRDSARLLDATRGADLGAPYVAPEPRRPYAEELSKEPRRLRIGMSTKTATGVELHPECLAAVDRTMRILTDLGHDVQEAEPEIDGAELSQRFTQVWASGVAADCDAMKERGMDVSESTLEPLTMALWEIGRSTTAAQYLNAVQHLQQIGRVMAKFMVRHDVWLTSTLAEPPVPLGTFEPVDGNALAAIMRAAEFVPYTPLANISGQPAMSVPLHRTPEGLPVGSHFIGRYGQEGALFALAAQIERAAPWTYEGVIS